jgi:hypothetical protein
VRLSTWICTLSAIALEVKPLRSGANAAAAEGRDELASFHASHEIEDLAPSSSNFAGTTERFNS